MVPNMENSTPTPGASAPQLELNDLAAVVRLIDIVSRRGAFEGSELVDIGNLRGRLIKFIEAVQPPKKEETTQIDAGKIEEFPKQK